MNRNNKKAFTLIELLVAVTLISILGLAVYSTLYHGLNIWKRASRDDPRMRVDLFLAKLDQDLRNSVFFVLPAFVGKERSVEFFLLAPVKASSLKQVSDQQETYLPARMVYSFDASSRQITKRQDDSFQVLYPKEPQGGLAHPEVKGVERLSFRYYGYDDQTQEWRWRSDWPGPCFPKAVEAQVGFELDGKRSATKIMSIPAAFCGS